MQKIAMTKALEKIRDICWNDGNIKAMTESVGDKLKDTFCKDDIEIWKPFVKSEHGKNFVKIFYSWPAFEDGKESEIYATVHIAKKYLDDDWEEASTHVRIRDIRD